MDLTEVQALVALADTGSLLGAAEALLISRSTLRRRLEALEARAGVALFHRSHSGASLTAAGHLLAERGRGLVVEANGLLAAVREVGREATGLLRVVVPVGLPPHGLTALFQILRRRHPGLAVELRVTADPTAEPIDEVDVVLHFGHTDPRGPWICWPLFEVRDWLVASPAYLARHGTPETPTDLARHTLLAWEGPDVDPRRWPLRPTGTLAVSPVLVSTHIHWLRQCAIEGQGIAFLPDARLPDPGVAPKDALRPVLPEQVGRARSLRVAIPQAIAELPRVKVVLELVAQWRALQPHLR